MSPDTSKARLRTEIMAIRSILAESYAERESWNPGEDDALLEEGQELLASGIDINFVTEWLRTKTGLVGRQSRVYKVCEAVLNLSIRYERQHSRH